MPRNFDAFHGDSLLVAGGWLDDNNLLKPFDTIYNPDNFFAIDINKNIGPDAVIDITNENQCSIFPDKKFSFIYFECLPWLGEEELKKAFQIANRILKDDGVLIYRGGSDKASLSIPEILKDAGFEYAIKKELGKKAPEVEHEHENGGISLASKMDLNLIEKNLSSLAKTAQYYLNYYKFFQKELFYLGTPYDQSEDTMLEFLKARYNYKIRINSLPEKEKQKLIKLGFDEENSIEKYLLLQQSIISKFTSIQTGVVFTPLTYAAKEGDFDLVKALLKAHVEINRTDQTYFFTPLMWASWYGRNDIVKYLLEKGADATLNGFMPSSLGYRPCYTDKNRVNAHDLTKYSYISPSGFWYATKHLTSNVDINKTRDILERSIARGPIK